MGEIVLDRLARTLVGPAGQRVELPLLSLRLLEALAALSPAFVGTDLLLQRVWPDTHIGADSLKQRVRLLRLSLTAAGYDARLLDSVRGEGYALRAVLRDALPDEVRAEAAAGPLAAPIVTATHSSERRWAVIGVGIGAVVLMMFYAFRPDRSDAAVTPIGPSPVRVGLVAPSGNAVGAILVDALSGNAHLLVVPTANAAGGTPGCATSAPIHLCLLVTPVTGDPTRQTLTLSQRSSGAILLRADSRIGDRALDVAPFVLRLVQFATPGVLRWIGGPTGAGDHAFTQYREGVRLLGGCDAAARRDVIAGLKRAAERSPNFLPGRAMLALHEVNAAVAEGDSVHAATVMREAESLIVAAPDLALAHLAVARGASMLGNDSLARSAVARAIRLQPVLSDARLSDDSCGMKQDRVGGR